MNRIWCLVCLVFACSVITQTMEAKQIRNRHYKYRISIPDAMKRMEDTGAVGGGVLYYDTATKIVLMISERQSEFQSVNDYIDCSRKELEKQLKYYYADPTLTLVNCSKSQYYPEKTTAILFHVSVLPYGFNTCLVYFVHHRHKDLQFSFMYKEDPGREPQQYINAIMQTLKLK